MLGLVLQLCLFTEGRDENPAKKLVISKINFEICMSQRNLSWKVLNFCFKIYNDGFVQHRQTPNSFGERYNYPKDPVYV
jgi:hypothetical protein